MSKVIGIDLGSRTTKIVQLVDGEIQHQEIFETSHDPLTRVKKTLGRLGESPIMATGYGRHLICENFDAERISEIKACGRGAHHLFPSCRSVLDIGGQDYKLIQLNEKGNVLDFEMNDRCAAGTGKFLEIMAHAFNTDIETFVQTALNASNHINITSMCTVFAESEVVSLITSGKPKDEIALGLHLSIAQRLQPIFAKMPLEEDILFVGGGAKNDCLHTILEKQLKQKIKRPEEPQIVVALGAALLANDTAAQ
jgi:predicted CoA-substrate-specific enzyme activase